MAQGGGSYPTTDMCDGELLAAFEPTTRPTDIFVSTAAKCGQTWLMALMHHLATRGQDSDFGGLGLQGRAPWLEFRRNFAEGGLHPRSERLELFASLPDPRLFKMHVEWDEIPRARDSGAKIVTITRDPRDLPYSMYCHRKAMIERGYFEAEDNGFAAYFERWMDFGYFFKFVQSFWPHRHDDDVLWLRYEDMKADLEFNARKILRFTGWSVTDEELARCLQLVTFAHLKANERQTMGSKKEESEADSWFFREGAVGKNRQQLTEAQTERIVERARREFEPECLDWVFSQGL